MTAAAIVIDLDPNLFQLGPFLITWHGVFSVLGILAAARLGAVLASRDGIPPQRIYDAAVWMVVAGLIGARLLFVWEHYSAYAAQPWRIVAIAEGGISQWGGLYGAMAGAYLWAWRHHVPFSRMLDAGGPATLIGLAVGRIGDVINGEHHGTPTNLPWGVQYVNEHTLGEMGKVVHPEVAYELLWCLFLLGLLMPFHERLKAGLPAGASGLLYLAVYAAGRFFLSFLRTDPAVFLGLRQAQLASLLMVLVALVLIPWLVRRRRGAGAAGPTPAPPARA
ncbi:MAG TPA: prolipoprotein diacylglyceryl transferase [Candidatus Acidoferrales bacterium]|nr:prolipoprotein diacylglyceryl transferase [Candidatus Acidoferrales bacterium]